ncbi:MAG: hypothetical protein ACE5HR_00415 [bacterium]
MKVEEIKYSARQVDEKDCPWADDYRPHWKLTFRYQGKSASFDFWNNFENQAPSKEAALELIIGDALYSDMSLDDLASELGMSPSQAIRSQKACGKTFKKLARLFCCGREDLEDLLIEADKCRETLKPESTETK